MLRQLFSLILVSFLIFSCEEIINEENLSNKTIQLLAPTNNAIIAKKTVISFNWDVLTGATQYRLQIATPNFANATQIKLDTLINSRNFTIDSLSVKTYEWRVKGVNSVYETAYSAHIFTVE